jgi:hypothetical protein
MIRLPVLVVVLVGLLPVSSPLEVPLLFLLLLG